MQTRNLLLTLTGLLSVAPTVDPFGSSQGLYGLLIEPQKPCSVPFNDALTTANSYANGTTVTSTAGVFMGQSATIRMYDFSVAQSVELVRSCTANLLASNTYCASWYWKAGTGSAWLVVKDGATYRVKLRVTAAGDGSPVLVNDSGSGFTPFSFAVPTAGAGIYRVACFFTTGASGVTHTIGIAEAVGAAGGATCSIGLPNITLGQVLYTPVVNSGGTTMVRNADDFRSATSVLLGGTGGAGSGALFSDHIIPLTSAMASSQLSYFAIIQDDTSGFRQSLFNGALGGTNPTMNSGSIFWANVTNQRNYIVHRYGTQGTNLASMHYGGASVANVGVAHTGLANNQYVSPLGSVYPTIHYRMALLDDINDATANALSTSGNYASLSQKVAMDFRGKTLPSGTFTRTTDALNDDFVAVGVGNPRFVRGMF